MIHEKSGNGKPAFAADYVQVNERIIAFRAKYPDGSLQAEIVAHTDNRITMRAFAYRTPDDARPGVGHSTLEIPGRTPYTRGSEIENCETSAWGRALAALGFEVKRGIASHEEVANKRDTGSAHQPSEPETEPETEGNHEPLFGASSIPDARWDAIGEMWHTKGVISEAQRKRIYAIAKGNGWTSDLVDAALLSGLADGATKIPWGKPYDAICALFGEFRP